MAVITSGSFAKALWPGVNSWYGKAYSEFQTQYDKLFDKYSSRRAYEEDVGITSFGLAKVKSEGAPIQYDSENQGFVTRYTHVTYALGFIITREMFDDDQYDVVGERRAKGLAFSMRQTKEIIGANVYNRAFNSSYTGGDGQSLISSAHPNVAGGTWSNQPTVNADLSEAALEQAFIDLSHYTNDRGMRIAVRPKTLIIPAEYKFIAERILKSDLRVGTANNDANALKNLGLFSDVVINNYLTSSTAWFIRTDVQDGLKYFERRGDEFNMDNDFDTENAKYKASSRYSFGWTDPRSLYGAAGF